MKTGIVGLRRQEASWQGGILPERRATRGARHLRLPEHDQGLAVGTSVAQSGIALPANTTRHTIPAVIAAPLTRGAYLGDDHGAAHSRVVAPTTVYEEEFMPDSILLDVAAGKASAVQDCIRHFSGSVWSLARRSCPTEQDAEDAVQEIFLDVWKSASRFDPGVGSDLTFVMTIARRRLIDRTRRIGRTPPVQSLVEPETLVDEPADATAELNEEFAQVRAAMGRLRPEQRDVLQMSLMQGHTHQQVAERTGMPLGTVKSHARRGLMRIRDMLGASPSDPAHGDQT